LRDLDNSNVYDNVDVFEDDSILERSKSDDLQLGCTPSPISHDYVSKSKRSERSEPTSFPTVLKSKSGLKLAHLNARSLKCNANNTIDQLRVLLMNRDIDIFAVSETWLSPEVSDTEIQIDGYSLIRNDRNGRGGGVAIYVKSSIPHSVCNELNTEADIEAVWITVNPDNFKPFKLCSFYRPPSANADYFDKMLINFEAAMSNDEVVILGDFNMNYVADETLANNPAHHLEVFLNCTQLITVPTRVSENCSTTIDLIYTSMPETHSASGVVECTISDHYMTYTVLECKTSKRAPARFVSLRDFKHFNPVNYNNDLMDCGLVAKVNASNSIDEAWELWSTAVLGVMNKHALLKTHRLKARSNPWITREIITLMHRKMKQSKDVRKEYKKVRNQVVKEIRFAKKSHYRRELATSSGPKQTWKVIRSLIKSDGSETGIPVDPDAFNTYFSTVGSTLNQTFPNKTNPAWNDPECLYRFCFSDILEEEILKYLKSLSDTSNTDVLGFDSKLLLHGAEVLTASLTELFNGSISKSSLPTDWKRARVTPIYKGNGAKSEPGNYRPISVVSHIPKALEKCVNSQLTAYLNQHSLLSCDQSAFRQGHSTTTSAHKLLDDLMDNINEGMINAICFFDLKKCFDTIDHPLLLAKLQRYGITGYELSWFENYLSDRTQLVAVNGAFSEKAGVSTGVPQGSVLGPLLFLLFINDLPKCLKHSSSNIYADDTAIYACGNSVKEVSNLLQRDIENISMWFAENKLTVNSTKSYCMLITSNRNLLDQKLDIRVNNTIIEQVRATKYLGLFPDSSLTWTEHVSKLCSKLAPKVGILRRLRHVISTDCLKMIYQSTVQSLIDYCITVWGFSSNRNLDLVQRLQNRAARIILGNYSREVRGIDLVKDLGWFNVRQRRDYFTGILVYKALNGLSTEYMSDLFTYVRDVNLCNTRSASDNTLTIPKVNKHVFSQSIQVSGPRTWNRVPSEVRTSNSLCSFKTSLSNYLLKSS